jgi:hypothetical protein
MKKIKFLLSMLAVVGLVSLFSACTETETVVTVTITPDSDSIYAAPNDVVAFAYTLTPDVVENGEVGNFYISDGTTDFVDTNFASTSSVSGTFNYTVPSDAVAGTVISLTFDVTDAVSGQHTVESVQINVETGFPEIVTDTEVEATYNSQNIANTMIFDLLNTGVEMKGGTFEGGELAYAYNGTYGYNILSPDNSCITSWLGSSYTTSDKQTTKIMEYTGNWDDLDQETLDALVITSETVLDGNGIQVGHDEAYPVGAVTDIDMVVFETEDGRKGALKITYMKYNAKMSTTLRADFIYQEETAGTSGK